MSSPFIIAQQIQVKHQQQVILNQLNFTINKGEHWLLTGEAGSGKSTLAKLLGGQTFYTGSLSVNYNATSGQMPFWYVPQWHHFTNHAGISDFYYQQRYNSSDADDARTVTEDIKADFPQAAAEAINTLLEQLGIGHRAGASLLLLSSGEQKKLQLVKAILAAPQLLVLDNPYIGLDIASRKQLNETLGNLTQQGTQLIIISDTKEIPACITHVAVLNKTPQPKPAAQSNPPTQPKLTAQQLQIFTVAAFNAADHPVKSSFAFDTDLLGDAFTATPENSSFQTAVELNNVNITYGDKKVLQQVSWTVNKGEKWLLQGHNGAGKSTLLSLITGDNPQAYANNITLFNKKRGSGESIWDIKKKIGFVSPELHWYFDKNTTCREVILSGFFDTTGLYRTASAEQQKTADAWLHCLQLQSITNKLLAHVSIGQQQLLLLARAFVKNPPLLLLDEPFQGVDEEHAAQFITLIDAWMQQPDRTLIYISHRNDQIPACVNHVFVLEQGKHHVKPIKKTIV
ncbi:ATP-binding cassette domain-containing protein [Filimonas effusa]|uniref:ATP-binding cassette domain-containing protein n=1 Tax=Filimonas effusa TaxID=2508721 RepID=A0A4Q1D520_9BACT|nr:ATP-binding cassette domain-containing protein [Filimonas effusa]RXK82767.1 ATP-binding cassette domain-containing protein [Filimonas effusa]